MRYSGGSAALVAVVVLLAGCGADDALSDAPGEARTEEGDGAVAGSQEQSAAVDPTVLPDDPEQIDATYAQTVVDELQGLLYATDIEAAAAAPLDDEGLPADVVARYRAVLSPAQATGWIASQEALLAGADDVEVYAESLSYFGVPVWEVHRPYTPGFDCIPFAYDVSLEHDQAPPYQGVAALVPRDSERDPEGHNPTPWVLGLHAASAPGEQAPEPSADIDAPPPGSVVGVCSRTQSADEAAADADAALADR